MWPLRSCLPTLCATTCVDLSLFTRAMRHCGYWLLVRLPRHLTHPCNVCLSAHLRHAHWATRSCCGQRVAMSHDCTAVESSSCGGGQASKRPIASERSSSIRQRQSYSDSTRQQQPTICVHHQLGRDRMHGLTHAFEGLSHCLLMAALLMFMTRMTSAPTYCMVAVPYCTAFALAMISCAVILCALPDRGQQARGQKSSHRTTNTTITTTPTAATTAAAVNFMSIIAHLLTFPFLLDTPSTQAQRQH
jgi:hypothetical protein